MGRFEKAVLSLFTKEARVDRLRRVAEAFTLVTLAGDELRGASWSPGQKVQIAVRGFTQRTFTPLAWNASEGSTELLVYAHGEGLLARWLATLAVETPCSIFGPRRSLELDAVKRPALFFGDETSFGLARALASTSHGVSGASLLFEVTSKVESERALAALGIGGASLVERRANDAHASELEEAAETLVRRHALENAVLSGKATTIQTLKRRLSGLGLARERIRTKAYWAPGKSGLD